MTLPSPLKSEAETTDLAGKSLTVLRLQKAAVDLVGSVDDGRHGVLVARGHDGEERERRQRQVVHAARHAALVVAVRVQAGKRKEWKRVNMEAGSFRETEFQLSGGLVFN